MLGEKVVTNRWQRYGNVWGSFTSLVSANSVQSCYLEGPEIRKVRDVEFQSIAMKTTSRGDKLWAKFLDIIAKLTCRNA